MDAGESNFVDTLKTRNLLSFGLFTLFRLLTLIRLQPLLAPRVRTPETFQFQSLSSIIIILLVTHRT